jgi:leader peptidase (prepilin peptidase)/N-methyltransferase
MEILFYICVFIFGLLIGSFLNVVIYRYNTGLSIAHGRSQCFVCGKSLVWYELIPVFSFLFQKGRCRKCGTRISWQYPVVELCSALLFICVVFRQISLYPLYSLYTYGVIYSVLFAIYYSIIASLLIVITVYDIRHMIIPNGLVYTFIILAGAKLFLFLGIHDFELTRSMLFDAITPIVLGGFFGLLWLVSKGMWIGFGDAKLAFGIGALLGFSGGISAIMLGFWIGAIYSIGILVWQYIAQSYHKRKFGMKTEIPFAPFLIAGTLIVLFSHIDVLGISTLIYG